MATTHQIYNILNSINAQANTGATLVKTSTDFISYGDTISNLSQDGKETWFATLLDRIGSTVMDNRAYSAKSAVSLWKSPFEYGAIMQKLFAKRPSISTDSAFTDPGDYAGDPFAPVEREIVQRLYGKQSVWQIKDTIPSVQLTTAFTSEEAMAAFLNNLMLSTQNALVSSLENLANITRSSMIAKAYLAGGAHVVKLLTLYNSTFTQSLTAPECLYSRDFLRFASLQIALKLDQMQHLTDIFSADGYERFSDRSFLSIAVLGVFDDSISSYLASDTYHEKLVELPSENKYIAPYWQATGTALDMVTSPRSTWSCSLKAALVLGMISSLKRPVSWLSSMTRRLVVLPWIRDVLPRCLTLIWKQPITGTRCVSATS